MARERGNRRQHDLGVEFEADLLPTGQRLGGAIDAGSLLAELAAERRG
ncbi:hypothetical protein O4H62_04115 [Hoeflea alexandrii]|nr:hypothetical protein [Hoeflea alexandrii]